MLRSWDIGNDHQPKKLLIVKIFLLASTIRNEKKTVWRSCIFIYNGCSLQLEHLQIQITVWKIHLNEICYTMMFCWNLWHLFLVVDFKISKDATELPKQIKYSLRFSHTISGSRKSWRTENTYPNFQAVGPRVDEDG